MQIFCIIKKDIKLEMILVNFEFLIFSIVNKKWNADFGQSTLSHNPILNPTNNLEYNKYLRNAVNYSPERNYAQRCNSEAPQNQNCNINNERTENSQKYNQTEPIPSQQYKEQTNYQVNTQQYEPQQGSQMDNQQYNQQQNGNQQYNQPSYNQNYTPQQQSYNTPQYPVGYKDYPNNQFEVRKDIFQNNENNQYKRPTNSYTPSGAALRQAASNIFN